MAEHCFSLRLRRGGAIQTVIDVPDEYKAKSTPVVRRSTGTVRDTSRGRAERASFLWRKTDPNYTPSASSAGGITGSSLDAKN